jgi:hypothetical protein
MMKKPIKPAKGTIPAGFANGGKVMPFKGKDNKAEEMAEAKAVRSGKVTPKQYAAGEKKEGDKKPMGKLMATGKALASGKMPAAKYAASAKKGG